MPYQTSILNDEHIISKLESFCPSLCRQSLDADVLPQARQEIDNLFHTAFGDRREELAAQRYEAVAVIDFLISSLCQCVHPQLRDDLLCHLAEKMPNFAIDNADALLDSIATGLNRNDPELSQAKLLSIRVYQSLKQNPTVFLSLQQRALFADKLMNALEQEHDRLPFERNNDLETALLGELTQIGHPRLEAILEAIVENKLSDIRLKDNCKTFLQEIRLPLRQQYEGALVDQCLTAEERSKQLIALDNSPIADERFIDATFACLKGACLQPSREAALALSNLFESRSETVRLALCLSFIQELSHDDSPMRDDRFEEFISIVFNGLARLAIETRNAACANLSVKLMNLALVSSKHSLMMEAAKESATRRFLTQSKHYKI